MQRDQELPGDRERGVPGGHGPVLMGFGRWAQGQKTCRNMCHNQQKEESHMTQAPVTHGLSLALHNDPLRSQRAYSSSDFWAPQSLACRSRGGRNLHSQRAIWAF